MIFDIVDLQGSRRCRGYRMVEGAADAAGLLDAAEAAGLLGAADAAGLWDAAVTLL